MDAQQCGFSGNSDLYGLGIRIGVYTQILSTIITNHFLPAAMAGNSTANLIFLWALILAVVRSVTADSNFHVAECYVILQLILTFFFASTEGRLFVWAELFTAFLDGHLPPAVAQALMRSRKDHDRDWTGLRISDYLSNLARAYTNVTPLRTSFRKILCFVAASLNFWFWVFGVRELKQAGSACPTYVFLFAPLPVTTSIRAIFMTLSLGYLAYRSVLVLSVLIPYPSPSWKHWLLKRFDPRSKSLRRLQDQTAEADKLDFGQADQTRRSWPSARLLVGLHATMLTWSSSVLCYSVIAVELTLAWNHVTQVYEVSSTGQFIPLLIGTLGLARALVSAFISKSIPTARQKIDVSTLQKKDDSAKFQYYVGPCEKIVFDARRPARRQSVGDLDATRPAPKVLQTYAKSPLFPVLPVQPWQEVTRLNAPEVHWNTGRFVCVDRAGGRHVFHSHLLERRMSWDGVQPVDFLPAEPHRARHALLVPLSQRQEAIDTEAKRERWFEWKRKRVQRQVLARSNGSKKKLIDNTRWTTFSEGVGKTSSRPQLADGNAIWLPQDVNDETLFAKEPQRRRSVSSSSSSSSSRSTDLDSSWSYRRNSEDVGPVFFDSYAVPRLRQSLDSGTRNLSAPDVLVHMKCRDERQSSGLAEHFKGDKSFAEQLPGETDARFMCRTRMNGRSCSPRSFAGSLRSARPSSTMHGQEPLLKQLTERNRTTVAACCALFAFCGLLFRCFQARWKFRANLENVQLDRRMHRQPPTYPRIQETMTYQCKMCDEAFQEVRRTRQWQQMRMQSCSQSSENDRRFRSIEKKSFTYVKCAVDGLHRLSFYGFTTFFTLFCSRLKGIELVKGLEKAFQGRISAYEIEFEEMRMQGGEEPGAMV